MPSTVRWTAFDYTESRLGGRERHVEGRDRLAETFQGQVTEVFQRNRFFHCGCDAATYQYLPAPGLGAQPSRQIAHRADRGVAGALGEADLPERRVALGDASAKAQLAVAPTPRNYQLARRLAHRHRHLDRPLGRVRDRHGVVEEHHDPVAGEL